MTACRRRTVGGSLLPNAPGYEHSPSPDPGPGVSSEEHDDRDEGPDDVAGDPSGENVICLVSHNTGNSQASRGTQQSEMVFSFLLLMLSSKRSHLQVLIMLWSPGGQNLLSELQNKDRCTEGEENQGNGEFPKNSADHQP